MESPPQQPALADEATAARAKPPPPPPVEAAPADEAPAASAALPSADLSSPALPSPLPSPTVVRGPPASAADAGGGGGSVVGLGVYFGSFDPLHENHVAVAKHAIATFGLRWVYLVCTANRDASKPHMASLTNRAHLIDARLSEADCAGSIRRYDVKERQRLDWPGRAVVCDELYAAATRELGDVRVCQLMGQDSFEDVVHGWGRKPGTKTWILSSIKGRSLILFPRTTAPSPIRMPQYLWRTSSVPMHQHHLFHRLLYMPSTPMLQHHLFHSLLHTFYRICFSNTCFNVSDAPRASACPSTLVS